MRLRPGLWLALCLAFGPACAWAQPPSPGDTPAKAQATADAGDSERGGDRPHRGHDDHDRPRRDRGEPSPVPAGVVVPAWSELSPAQQARLASMEKQWDTMSASRRVRALENLERRARWEAMTPEERERIREGARNFHDMPPELREKMRTSMQTMRALPEAERKELFRLWRSLDPEQRRKWLEAGGPGISAPPAQ